MREFFYLFFFSILDTHTRAHTIADDESVDLSLSSNINIFQTRYLISRTDLSVISE